MANATFRGIITMIDQSRIYGSFEKRIFWLQEQGVQYPSTWQLECQQNDCNILDNFQVGQEVECQVNIRGRYWEKPEENRNGVANTLRCWKISPAGQQQQYGAPQPQGQYRQPQQQPQQRTYNPPMQQQPAAAPQQYRQPAPPQKQYTPPTQQQEQQGYQQQPEQQQEGENSDLPF